MAYTTARLLELFRQEVDDTVEEYLWSDDEFLEYLDEAQKEFARETEYFKDSSTPAVTQCAVTAYDPWIAIDPRVVDIRRAVISGRTVPLEKINFNELEQRFRISRYGEELSGNWDTVEGTPRYIVMDIEVDKARLVPKPVEAGTVSLTVIREPLLDIEDKNDDLELTKSIHQRILLAFCKGMAYNKQDSETYDPVKADKFQKQFYDFCEHTRKRQNRKQRRIGTVKYGGY